MSDVPVVPIPLTPTILIALASALMSILFSRVPGLNDWFQTKSATFKSGFMALIIIAIALIAFGASCTSLYTSIPCTQNGVVVLVWYVFVSLSANQSTYKITPQRILNGSRKTS